MILRSIQGFTLAEVLIGIVLFGLFAVTLFPALSALDKLQQTGRQNGRKAEVVSLQEGLIARGLNPATVGLAHSPAISAVGDPSYSIDRSAWLAHAGRVSVWKIQGEATINNRMLAYGFQVGAGSNSIARPAVSAPLPPIPININSLSPDGPELDVSALSIPPIVPGGPWGIQLSATGDSTARIKIRFLGSSALTGQGIGNATLNLSANDLLSRGTVEAWAEYAGTAADTSETLADGRTNWWVATADGTQSYTASEKLTRIYQLSVGSPVLAIAGETFSSGSTVPVDLALSKLATSAGAQIRYQDDVLAKFGSASPTWSYAVIFQATPGPLSGDVSSFFSGEAVSLWSNPSVLTATPSSGTAGLLAAEGVWQLTILPTKLSPPDLVTIYADDLSEEGMHTFLAPLIDGARVGRVSSGPYESTGTTLTIDIEPPN